MKFKHSNIVKTFGVLIDEKAFMQEYCVKVVQGNEIHSLLGLINKLSEDFPLEVKLTCFLNITKALSYLHIENIVVGDLKPANVLVTSSAEDEWIFKLAGIAPETRKRNDCSAVMSSCISEKNNFVFTAAYLAPELLKFNSNMNENKAVVCDIYSFAMMMYQVLFPNVPLFEEINPIQFIIAVTNKWRPSIPGVNNSVYKRLVHLMEICWDIFFVFLFFVFVFFVLWQTLIFYNNSLVEIGKMFEHLQRRLSSLMQKTKCIPSLNQKNV